MDALVAAEISLFESFRLDRRAGVLFRRDQQGVFTPTTIGRRALDILGMLVERPGDLISKDEIIETVWPATTVEDSNLNVQIATLRRILDGGRAEGSCIQTVSGRGYRFVGPVRRAGPAAPPAGTGQPHASSIGISAHLAAAAPRLSIVVLPFSNLSDDREQQYFADGITEDLTTDLSRIDGSFVISRNTAFTYRGKPIDTKQIGRELCVRYVLEGSIRRSGNQVRVNAQLIGVETGAHLWAERFDRDAGDLFALQDEITSRIAVALNLELVGAEAVRPTDHLEVLDYILRGRAAMYKPAARESYAEAISLFERALAVDPDSVDAQGWFAITLVRRVLNFGSKSAEADIKRAEELATKAVAASPRSGLAHDAKGDVLRVLRRCAEAIPEYETALALNRNSVSTLAAIGRCKIYIGPIEEAIPAQEQAIRLSPRDPGIALWYNRVGEAHLLQSRTDEAIPWLEKARSANAALPFVHAWLASAYALKGETERAAAELAEARSLGGEGSYPSIARMRASTRYEAPTIRTLAEATYYAGLRKAGMPEE